MQRQLIMSVYRVGIPDQNTRFSALPLSLFIRSRVLRTIHCAMHMAESTLTRFSLTLTTFSGSWASARVTEGVPIDNTLSLLATDACYNSSWLWHRSHY